MTKRFLTAISIFCVLLVLLPQSANAATFDTPAKSAILMEASTGTISSRKCRCYPTAGANKADDPASALMQLKASSGLG